MNTERLVESLARNVAPVRPLRLPWIRAAFWSLAACAYALVLALLLTSGDDVAINGANPGFLVYQGASIAMAIGAVAAAFSSTVPGYSHRIMLLPASAAAVWLATLLVRVPQEWRAVGLAGLTDRHELLCIVTIVVTAVPPAFGLALMLRSGAPLTPRLTLALSALAAAGLTNAVTCLASPHTSGIAVLAWHGTTLIALCVLAAAIGRSVLPWKMSIQPSVETAPRPNSPDLSLGMDFALDEHQQDVQRRARAFAATEVAPVAAALDRAGSIPPGVISGVAELGLLGGEHDFVAYVAGLIEISKAWASLGAVIAVHNSLVCYPLARYGNAAQKQSYLSRLTAQGQLGCYAFAEPSAGSDAGAIRTTAVADGDHFVLNGHKRFVTSGRNARIAIVYALTDSSRGRDGLTAFIVDTETPGFSAGETNEMLGLRASEAVDVLLRECRVPKSNLLGALNQGFAIARDIVEGGRIDIAAQAVGIGEACLAQSIAKARNRRQFGRPIAEFEAIQWMVADMSTGIDAARLLAFRAAAMRAENPADAGLTKASAMAKLFASEAANRAAYDALQIFGGHGYLTEHPVERYFRDARAMTLFEETSEIERLVIERELAK